jgi:hypothetical protein
LATKTVKALISCQIFQLAREGKEKEGMRTNLHGLGSGSSQLTGDDDLATLGAGLHDESEDTVAGSSNGETTEELVSEGLGLSNGGKSSVLDLLGIELKRVLGELHTPQVPTRCNSVSISSGSWVKEGIRRKEG